MRNLVKYIFLFSIVFNLCSCKPPSYFKTKNSSISLDSSNTESVQAMLMIQPYKEKMDKEMNEVLVISANEFPKERGKSQTKLGNFVADLSLEIANKIYQPADGDSIDFCLLNFGGLRTSLPKGEITRGKIFELMPFENELVVVTINEKKMNNLLNYIESVGGQPVSGGINLDFQTREHFKAALKYFLSEDGTNELKILTSDYLANGGDNMHFFLNPIKIEPVGIKLRDAIIQYCVEQNEKRKQLKGAIDNRIVFYEQ